MVYKKSFDYSYAIGAFVTIELLKNKGDYVTEIFMSSEINVDLKKR